MLLASVLVAGAIVGVVLQSMHAGGRPCPVTQGQIIWAEQVTQEEGDNPSPSAGLVSQADQLAACDGGQLIILRGAGQGAVQAGSAVALRIYREPGEIENDPTARHSKVQSLVGQAFSAAQRIRRPGAGRDIIGLLAAISSQLGNGTNDVWLQTLGLPTVNPANTRVLMATDPAEA